ncbi:chloride channel protein [Bacillus sp. NP157]|nr:chloride channel protein [Bacillus sp. NP157]
MQTPTPQVLPGGSIPVAPSLVSPLSSTRLPRPAVAVRRRTVWITGIAALVAIGVGLIAQALTALIGLVTHLAFYGTWNTNLVSPAGQRLGAWVILLPVVGGLVVGCMARWGSRAIRGHGIPEAMEQVLRNESRIPPAMTWLKPVSSAVAIGTGGPFGAEGPIIATGGALGSLVGQLIHVTADERKVLLAAGAAAGMSAVFAAPVAAVLLAIELLLFERRARSLIPVALAAVIGAAAHGYFEGTAPMFAMPSLAAPGTVALLVYVALGAVAGVASVGITRATYAVEDAFEKLPIHWMWWPAIGGLAVGLVGYVLPSTLGVGYGNISAVISGQLGLAAMAALCLMKFLSWVVALGSGTSGGTLAPLFTIGGALGGVLGTGVVMLAPNLGVDPRMAALVCMAAVFAGASRAFLTSVVFAFETTLQPHGLLPLLGACAAAYMVSGLMMRTTIMTEKIIRRGVRVPSDYSADFLDQVLVRDACSKDVVSLHVGQSLGDVRQWMSRGEAQASHQGYPVVDASGSPVGVLTRRDLLDGAHADDLAIGALVGRAPLGVLASHSLREAADHMVDADVGRLVVLDHAGKMVGFITRGDLLAAHRTRLRHATRTARHWSERSGQRVP